MKNSGKQISLLRQVDPIENLGVLSKANFETKKEEPELLKQKQYLYCIEKVPVAKDSIVQGDPNAPVTVITFRTWNVPFAEGSKWVA